MTAVIRKSETVTLTEKRRGNLHAVGWHVSTSVWSPPTDVYETNREYVIRLEVAGLHEEDFQITYEDGYLLITGIRSDVPERRAYHQMEIRFGKFLTVIAVPGPVNLDDSKAEYEAGFLTVTLPKAKSTEVKIGE